MRDDDGFFHSMEDLRAHVVCRLGQNYDRLCEMINNQAAQAQNAFQTHHQHIHWLLIHMKILKHFYATIGATASALLLLVKT